MRAFGILLVAVSIAAFAGCASHKKANLNSIVALWMRDNPNDNIRDWEVTSYEEGTVDPHRVGLVADGRVAAVKACFKWIHSYGSEVRESAFNICGYYIPPITAASNRVIWTFGSSENLRPQMENDDWQRN
jgi:hypothetical protein